LLNSYKVEIYTGAAQPAVPLCDLKQQVSVDDDYFNDMLEAFGDSAQQYIERVTGRILSACTYDLYLDGFPDSEFKFLHGPVTAITSIYYLVGGVYTLLPNTVYTLGRGTLISQGIRLAYGQSWPTGGDSGEDCVRVRFAVGAENKTANLAIKLLVGHWFANREAVNVGNITSELPFGVQELIKSLKSYTL
jgi:uncharacterized phiE125 gp8 family phage protein